ncbi:hypothetical protein [Teredinibacter turnerae]
MNDVLIKLGFVPFLLNSYLTLLFWRVVWAGLFLYRGLLSWLLAAIRGEL